ncbi:ABC transporter permease [Rhodococcus pyridinivorans]|uniref:ABC transporter permease n=1 Tax=Rhodococcus pyridinivorans TaxID=103816 RepID=UPI001906FB40|nr:FtsX-like permease family protein [Rhodococcus pyridinivorans]QQM54371.1 FtsX-like permease family protein [Rhodococcus pyridinivorans]
MSGNPIRRVALRNLAAHKVRLALTVLSVVLGTAFITGSFVFTDTLQRTFDGIFGDVAQGVDVRVSTEQYGTSGVPIEAVDQVVALPGVERTSPSIGGSIIVLDSEGAAIQTGGAPAEGYAYIPPDRLVGEPETFVAGGPPAESGQIALNESAAERGDLSIGDSTTVLTISQGMVPVTVSGIYELETDTGGYIGALFTEEQASQLFTDGRHIGFLDVAGDGSLSPEQLRDEIAAALPELKVQTGAEVTEETKSQVAEALNFLNYFLLAFGAIALLVGTFIIYNTFSMIVAQRLRELALLRAIGASRKQVGRSVTLEAFVVGLIGSIIGIAAGVALAYGLRAALNAADLGLPSGPLQLSPRTVIVALLVGVVVTVVSAYAPARRATHVPPVAAMREESTATVESLRIRTIIGVLCAIVGAALVVVGAQQVGGGAAATVGIGAFLLILSVLFAAPALSRPVVNALGAVFARPFGAIGRLARTNATRNPRRTAATAFALTLGLMLVSVIGVFGSSAKASVDALVDNGVEADFMLTGPQMFGVPAPAAEAVRGVDGIEEVVPAYGVQAKIDEDFEFGTGAGGPLQDVLDLDMVAGAFEVTGNEILVSQASADDHGWEVGSTVPLTSRDGDTVDTTVAGIFADNQLIGPWVVSQELFEQFTPPNNRSALVVLMNTVDGADPETVRASIEEAVKDYVIVQVLDREQFKGQQAQQIDMLLAILYGLLALAVVIAILGIVNTLALSVVERRREIGMLRAVGMQRAQVRRTIYLESLLIAVFGAVVGVVLGLAFGWAFVRTLADQGLDIISVPWSQVVGMLVASGIIGVLAALWPGQRAAKTPPLEAISDM